MCCAGSLILPTTERDIGFLHFVRTMAGKLKIKTNWTALGVGGVSFWTKKPYSGCLLVLF